MNDVEHEKQLRICRWIEATSDETHIIFKTCDTRIHRIKALFDKSSKITELSEDFSQERRRVIPLRWWRRCMFIGNERRQVLLAHPLSLHIFPISKRCNTPTPIAKDHLTLTKRFIVYGDIEMLEK